MDSRQRRQVRALIAGVIATVILVVLGLIISDNSTDDPAPNPTLTATKVPDPSPKASIRNDANPCAIKRSKLNKLLPDTSYGPGRKLSDSELLKSSPLQNRRFGPLRCTYTYGSEAVTVTVKAALAQCFSPTCVSKDYTAFQAVTVFRGTQALELDTTAEDNLSWAEKATAYFSNTEEGVYTLTGPAPAELHTMFRLKGVNYYLQVSADQATPTQLMKLSGEFLMSPTQPWIARTDRFARTS